ncbi:mRNA cap guanine-N7 methyltransferase [Coemansia sp. Benny D115]|nr:mRNA cap guanine-N7 methyltransferase [Coemansia sp. Benny D115]
MSSSSNSNSNDNEREASHGVGQRAASPGLTNEADNNGGNDNDNGSSPRHTVPSDGADAESNVPSTLAQAAASNAELVANHYNTRRELGIEGRMHTKITGLRLFNNWIKSILIGRHTTAGCKVLDLGCGKGGDLRKWAITGIGEYVGMDIAQVSVSQAQKRYSEMHNVRFKASFFAQDCYGEPLEKTLQPPDYQADVISAQFCLHYAFETEKKARQMMENVSSHLAPGGRFMCTIPNSNWLV